MSITSDQVGENVNRAVRKVALAVDQSVVLSTPVDKGPARSNWLVSLGSPRGDQIPAYAPGERLGVNEQSNAAAALAQGSSVVGVRKEGQDIFITNNIPYIGKLNDGSSAQAPANFVEKAVMEAREIVKGTRVLVSRF